MNSGPPPSLGEFIANWSIFRDAVITGSLAGALLGFLGVQIILRRMVFASSAIAQAAALGVALSFWVPAAIDPIGHAARHAADPSAHIVPLLFEPVIWALAAALLATLAFIANPVKLHLTRESVLGVVFLVGASGAVIIGDRITQESHDLAAILFGSAVVVERSDLVLVSIATVVILGTHVLLWRPLIFVAYDPTGAQVQELPVRKLNLFVFLAIGVAVALCTRALGALPVFAFSVLPAMAALTLTDNLAIAFALATGIGALSGGAGYVVSFRGELPVGATQAAVALGVLAAALVRRVIQGVSRGGARPTR
jgi:zinc transport system permease protein